MADDNPCPGENGANSPGVVKTTFHDLKFAGQTFISDSWYLYNAPARITTRSAIWAGSLAAVGGILYACDQEIHDAFHRNRDHALYKPIRKMGENITPIGHMGNTNAWYFGLLSASYIVGYEPLTILSAEILEAHFISGLGKNLCRYLIGRHRPHEDKGPRSFKRNDGTSFPSGHSINIMELATILSRHFDYLPFQITCYSLAGTVCLERITSNQHWSSDVFAGAVLGTITARTLLDRHRHRTVPSLPTECTSAHIAPRQITPRARWQVFPFASGQDRVFGLGFICQF